MANLHRGEIEAVLGGKARRLCLTLGSLAELECALGAGDLVGLAQRLETGRLKARDLIAILGAGLRGAGAPITNDEVAALSFPDGLHGCIRVAASLLAAAFGTDAEADAAANPPEPQGS